MGLLTSLFKRDEPAVHRTRSVPLNDIRNSIVQNIQSGELIGYDTYKVLTVQTEFTEKESKELTSPVYDILSEYRELHSLLRIENDKDCINVSYPEDGACLYVEIVGVGILPVPVRDLNDAEEIIVSLAGLLYRDLSPSLKSVALNLTSSELSNLCETISSEDIAEWYACRGLFETLRKGFVSNVRLFMGTTTTKRYNAGDTVSLTSFSRWSFSIGTANKIGEQIFAIYPDTRIEGLYHNGIGDLNGSVLINAGYRLRVERVISLRKYRECGSSDTSGVVYICDIEPDEDNAPRLISSFESAEDSDVYRLDDALVQLPERNPVIGQSFYSSWVEDDCVEFRRVCSDRTVNFDKVRVVVGETVVMSVGKGDDYQEIKSIQFTTYNETYIAVEEAMVNLSLKASVEVRNVLYSQEVAFMYEIASKFSEEGYAVLEQRCASQVDVMTKTEMLGVLVLAGENDKVIVKFKVGTSMIADFEFITEGKSTHVQLEFMQADLCDQVYDLVVRKFVLQQYNRVQLALGLVARYKRVALEVRRVGYYKVGNWECAVAFNGGTLEFACLGGSVIELEYSASLLDIMSAIVILMEGDE